MFYNVKKCLTTCVRMFFFFYCRITLIRLSCYHRVRICPTFLAAQGTERKKKEKRETKRNAAIADGRKNNPPTNVFVVAENVLFHYCFPFG